MRMPDWQNRVMRLSSKTLKGAVSGSATQHKAAERGEDRSTSTSSNKKSLDSSRRKQNRKNAHAPHQDSGPAANSNKII